MKINTIIVSFIIFTCNLKLYGEIEAVKGLFYPEIDDKCFNERSINVIGIIDTLFSFNDTCKQYQLRVIKADHLLQNGEKIILRVCENVSMIQLPHFLVLSECDSIYKKINQSIFRDSLHRLDKDKGNLGCKNKYFINQSKGLEPFFKEFSERENVGKKDIWNPTIKEKKHCYFNLPSQIILNDKSKLIKLESPFIIPLDKQPEIIKSINNYSFKDILLMCLIANTKDNDTKLKNIIIDGIFNLETNLEKELFIKDSVLYNVINLIEVIKYCDTSFDFDTYVKKIHLLDKTNLIRYCKALINVNDCDMVLRIVSKIDNINSEADMLLSKSFKYKKYKNDKDMKILISLVQNTNPDIGYAALYALSQNYGHLITGINIDPAIFKKNQKQIFDLIDKNINSQGIK